jgi:hypothetical protein
MTLDQALNTNPVFDVQYFSRGDFGSEVHTVEEMSRHVHLALVLVLAAAGLASLGAQSSCSGSMPLKEEGEPCTRTSECDASHGLVCAGGVCRATSDAAPSTD